MSDSALVVAEKRRRALTAFAKTKAELMSDEDLKVARDHVKRHAEMTKLAVMPEHLNGMVDYMDKAHEIMRKKSLTLKEEELPAFIDTARNLNHLAAGVLGKEREEGNKQPFLGVLVDMATDDSEPKPKKAKAKVHDV